MVDKLDPEEAKIRENIDNKIIAFQLQAREANITKDNIEVRNRFRNLKDTTDESTATYKLSIKEYLAKVKELTDDNDNLKRDLDKL